MKLATLVATANRVAHRGRRLDKIAALVELLRDLDPSDIETAVAFLSGELPDGRIGVGYATLRASLFAAGAATEQLEPPDPELSVRGVRNELRRIAAISGKGSQTRRTQQLGTLFARATADERDFLVRLLLGELRQGALEGIMLDALARATGIDLERVRRAAMLSGDIKRVAAAALSGGESALAEFRVEVFRAIQPMLAQPADGLPEALDRLDPELTAAADGAATAAPAGAAVAAVELKIDGARVQVHRRGDRVRVFSRRLNEVSASVPEIVELALAYPAEELILDGEAFVRDFSGRPLPFQVTMRRFGRKLEVEKQRAKLPLEVRYFDCLYRNGEELIDRPLSQRWQSLCEVVPPEQRIERIVAEAVTAAQRFFQQALSDGHEGVMVKSLGSTCAAGGRGRAWLKVKPSHTLDLVVLAAEWGSGRRRGQLSNLHLGARDPEGGFVMLGKTFKGLTDEMLAWQTEQLLALRTAERGPVVEVRPQLVAEIAFNNIQASPQYPAGMALRFARVKRYRDDKSPDQASTIDEVRSLFESERRS